MSWNILDLSLRFYDTESEETFHLRKNLSLRSCLAVLWNWPRVAKFSCILAEQTKQSFSSLCIIKPMISKTVFYWHKVVFWCNLIFSNNKLSKLILFLQNKRIYLALHLMHLFMKYANCTFIKFIVSLKPTSFRWTESSWSWSQFQLLPFTRNNGRLCQVWTASNDRW